MCVCRLCNGVWWHCHRKWSTLFQPKREMQETEQWPCVSHSFWTSYLQNARRCLVRSLWQWKDIISVQCSRLMVETAQCSSSWLQLLHNTLHLVNWLKHHHHLHHPSLTTPYLALNSDTGQRKKEEEKVPSPRSNSGNIQKLRSYISKECITPMQCIFFVYGGEFFFTYQFSFYFSNDTFFSSMSIIT